jgi:hypothetical protein
MKTAIVFRADGKLQAMFKIDNEEKFKVLLKSVYDFPYYIELIDDIPTLSSMMSVSQKDSDITIEMKDRYNSKTTIYSIEEVIVKDGIIICTEKKFNSIFN